MTNEDSPFLDAIRSHPEDDGPRLVYADWLDERGDADRAEFIRLQCQMERLSPSPRRTTLARRAEDLLAGKDRLWAGPAADGPQSLLYRRGFADEIRIDARGFLDRAERLTAAGTLRHVILTDVRDMDFSEDLCARLSACPQLGRLRALTFGGHGWNVHRSVTALTSSSYVNNLEYLDLGCYEHGPEDALALANCPNLGRLRTLNILNCDTDCSPPIGVEGALALLTSPHLANLTELFIDHSNLGVDGLRRMAAAPQLARLAAISLRFSIYGDDLAAGVRAFVTSPHAARLRSLRLGFNFVLGDDVARVFAGPSALADLTELVLSSNSLTSDGVAALAKSSHLGRLRELDLGENRFGLEGLRALASGSGLRRLRNLRLSGIFDWGWGVDVDPRDGEARGAALAALPCLPRLRSLNLLGFSLGPAGLRHILDALSRTSLEELDLSSNNLGEEGIRQLVASPHLGGLRSLKLGWNSLGDSGVAVLASAPLLEGILELNLEGNEIGPEGAAALASSPRMRRLTSLDLAWNHIGDSGLRSIALSPHSRRLAALHVHSNDVGDPGAEAVLSSPNLSRLWHMMIEQGSRLSDSTTQALRSRYTE